MSLKKLLSRASTRPGQFPQGITPALFKEFFELSPDSKTVLWRKAPAGKGNAIPGKPAGHAVHLNTTEGKLPQGIRIGFYGTEIRAEVVSYILHHGTFPPGKIIHKDRDRTNNHPDNFFIAPRAPQIIRVR